MEFFYLKGGLGVYALLPLFGRFLVFLVIRVLLVFSVVVCIVGIGGLRVQVEFVFLAFLRYRVKYSVPLFCRFCIVIVWLGMFGDVPLRMCFNISNMQMIFVDCMMFVILFVDCWPFAVLVYIVERRRLCSSSYLLRNFCWLAWPLSLLMAYFRACCGVRTSESSSIWIFELLIFDMNMSFKRSSSRFWNLQ